MWFLILSILLKWLILLFKGLSNRDINTSIMKLTIYSIIFLYSIQQQLRTKETGITFLCLTHKSQGLINLWFESLFFFLKLSFLLGTKVWSNNNLIGLLFLILLYEFFLHITVLLFKMEDSVSYLHGVYFMYVFSFPFIKL